MYRERKKAYDKSLKARLGYIKYVITNDIIHMSVTLFTPFEVIFTMLMLLSATSVYFLTLVDSYLLVLLLSILTSGYIYIVFILQNRKLSRKQSNMHELLKYINNTVYMLNSGEVVSNAIDSSVELLKSDVKNDVQRTRDILRNDVVIDTKHFEKYESNNLNQFHKNLEVKYERGGDTKLLFGVVQKRFANELQKMDELYRKKKRIRMNVIVLMGMVYSTAIILSMFTPDLWEIYLSHKLISTVSVVLFTLAGMIVMYQVQRHTMDISMDIRHKGRNLF